MKEDELLATILDEYSDEPHQGKSDAEIRLEHIVLGKDSDFDEVLQTAQKRRASREELREPGEPEGPREPGEPDGLREPGEPEAAWHDEDDDELVAVGEDKRYKRFRLSDEKFVSAKVLEKRFRNDLEKNLPSPAWAKKKLPKETNALSTSTGAYIDRESARLPLKNFSFKHLTNLNFESPAKLIAHVVEFHPTAQVAMVGSFDRTVTLFEVDGKHNPKLTSVFFKEFPVSCAHFLNQGNEFLASSKVHPHMYIFDLMSEKTVKIPWNKAIAEQGFKSFCVSPDSSLMAFPARDGNIHILSGRSKEWLYSLKMNGSTAAVAFSGDSKEVYSIGDEGKVHVWDLAARRCATTFMDDGCVCGTALAVSPNNGLLAVGSNTGVVNLYDRASISLGSFKPVKTVLNLTTSVTFLKFNPTSELLALGSNYSHGALKLLHLGEMQIVPSFPQLNDKIRQAETADFSLNSGYMAVGNNKGEALLYRLNHYKSF